MKILETFSILSFAVLSVSCATSPVSNQTNLTETDKFQLKVSLYPWIPEEKKFAQWIEEEFNEKNSDIKLVVRDMSLSTEKWIDPAYDVTTAVKMLSDDKSDDFQHLIEIDTIILGNLVNRKVIQPMTSSRTDFIPFAKKAVTFNNIQYGIPHWTCGYFMMTENRDISNATSSQELYTKVQKFGAENKIDLGGDISGSWSSVAVYLDAFLDTYPNKNISDALDDEVLDPIVKKSLQYIANACETDGQRYCDRGYEQMEHAFANGKLDVLLGYSERLNHVLREPKNKIKPDKVYISPAPLGQGAKSFLYTDALVMSSKCSSERCKDAVNRFVEFYVSDEVFEASMMSFDVDRGPKVPRYLLPSTFGAFSTQSVSNDPIYKQLRNYVSDAQPYPNIGILTARKKGSIKKEINEVLHNEKNP